MATAVGHSWLRTCLIYLAEKKRDAQRESITNDYLEQHIILTARNRSCYKQITTSDLNLSPDTLCEVPDL